MSWILLFALVGTASAKKNKKKKGKKGVPPVGWVVANQESGFSCFHPPAFDKLPELDRKQARADALDAMISQWNGSRGDGIGFDEGPIEDLEITLLGSPEKIEGVTRDNVEQCKKVAAGADASGWNAWMRGLPAILTEGECKTPFDVTMFDYLEIGTGWQREIGVCQGNRMVISATKKDFFQITEDGPMITADGDRDQPTIGEEWPCNFEGCYAGMLILRFTTDAGVETVIPVGTELSWEAPEHGFISYRINDTTFFDNKYRLKGSLIDKTGIQISAAE